MITAARLVADAVLYEGYLLYPYRASSAKNQVRWQFGVLGPPSAAEAGLGEAPQLHAECLLRGPRARVTMHVRFLQLQSRTAELLNEANGFEAVDRFVHAGREHVSWDEAVERELTFGPFGTDDLSAGLTVPAGAPGGVDVEQVSGRHRLVRTRADLRAELTLGVEAVDGLIRLAVTVANTGPSVADRAAANRYSLLGAHLLLEVAEGEFVSLLEPPSGAEAAAAGCRNYRCWPVLVAEPGQPDVLLVSPIILYDYPAVAPESVGDLYDATEIDEILTLRVMTLTDQEKAEARATDPRAAAIIDRCDAMSAEDLGRLHGVIRDPYAIRESRANTETDFNSDKPWWDAEVDASFDPARDCVQIGSVDVTRGSRVRVHPSRRADAQDLFFADRTARVTGVYFDADGDVHVAVVIEDDPAADLHDWYGRYLYFGPDELEPLPDAVAPSSAESAPSPSAAITEAVSTGKEM